MREFRPAPHLGGKSIEIIGAAIGAGAPDAHAAQGPDVLRASGLINQLRDRGYDVTWRNTARPSEGYDALSAVQQVGIELASNVENAVDARKLPLVIGGDHSCAIGTWKGLASAVPGPLGLIWIDAHMDAHTPQTSPSGALHGMPLACLLGYGEPRLTGIGNGISLLPEHVCVLGVRSFESGEAALLQKLGVRVFFMEEIVRRGIYAVMQEALAIATDGTAGFGASLDLDALDPRDAPGVGTPAANGVRAFELLHALKLIQMHPALAGLEIAEYNPHFDRNGKTGQLVLDLLQAMLPEPAKQPAPQSLMATEQRYGSHHYEPLPVVLSRGHGVYVWDVDDRRYLDMMSAYSAVSHGHGHPRLVKALTQQARRLSVTSRAYYNDRLPLFLQRLCEISGQDLALPVNTGLEAVEAALKTARKWGYKVKGIPDERAEIIACEGNFHGRSITLVGMSSEAQYRDGFGPYAPGFVMVPYGDARTLERAITPNTAAFLVEPLQGEAGIIVPPAGYLAQCAEICRRHNVLLICDEVQTGLGRTGRWFACEHDGVKPDGLILGKALGGGLLPVSAFLARRDVLGVLMPGDHGSTFGGNALAAAVGAAALDVMIEENLVQRAAELGAYLLNQLRMLRSPLIREVRGKGLLIGVEIDPHWASARIVCERLLQHGVLSKDTHHTVVRFAPPLVITREQIDEAVDVLRATLKELEAEVRHAA